MKALLIATLLATLTLLAPSAAAGPPDTGDMPDTIRECAKITAYPSEPTDLPLILAFFAVCVVKG